MQHSMKVIEFAETVFIHLETDLGSWSHDSDVQSFCTTVLEDIAELWKYILAMFPMHFTIPCSVSDPSRMMHLNPSSSLVYHTSSTSYIEAMIFRATDSHENMETLHKQIVGAEAFRLKKVIVHLQSLQRQLEISSPQTDRSPQGRFV
eukprot:gene7697-8505_t